MGPDSMTTLAPGSEEGREIVSIEGCTAALQSLASLDPWPMEHRISQRRKIKRSKVLRDERDSIQVWQRIQLCHSLGFEPSSMSLRLGRLSNFMAGQPVIEETKRGLFRAVHHPPVAFKIM